jgi:hypothetical protein
LFSTNLIKDLPSEFIGHSFYTEETATYELSLQRLPDTKITNKLKVFETTLLDCLDILHDKSNNKGNLEKFTTIRCATQVPERANFTPVKIKVPTTNQNSQPDFSEVRNDWKRFRCDGRGNRASDPRRHFTTEEVKHEPSSAKAPPVVEPKIFANPDQVAKVEQWKEEAEAVVAQGFTITPSKRTFTVVFCS